MIKRVPTNDCHIVVSPRSAGDFGWAKMSGIHRTPDDERHFCEEIVSQIKRHVDGVGSTDVVQAHLYDVDGDQFETLYEALEYKYGDENTYGERYVIRYVWNKEGHRNVLKTFRDVITEAWRCPEAFEVKEASPPLSEGQTNFLNNVLAAAKERDAAKV